MTISNLQVAYQTILVDQEVPKVAAKKASILVQLQHLKAKQQLESLLEELELVTELEKATAEENVYANFEAEEGEESKVMPKLSPQVMNTKRDFIYPNIEIFANVAKEANDPVFG